MSKAKIFVTMALLAAGIFFSPMAASASPNQGDFLDLKKAVLDINDHVITDIIFKAQAKIPKHPGIDWGYGIITVDESANTNVIATTSHPNLPIVDSILQNGNPANDIIHNHYVILGVDEMGLCGTDPFIQDLTFESPGKIFVKENEAILKNLPESVTGGNFPPEPQTFIPGTNYQVAASFLLEYVENPMDPMEFAICVVDVRPLDPQEQSTVIIGEKGFFDHKQKPHESKGGGYDLYLKDKHGGHDYSKESNYNKNDYQRDNNYGGYDYKGASYNHYD